MRNWRTSAFGIATAFFAFILFSPQYFYPWLVDLAKFAVTGGLAAIGLSAKDSNVHSTIAEVHAATAEQTGIPVPEVKP